MSRTHDKVLKLRSELNQMFPEREQVIDTCLIALLTKQHCFILGEPGTAKSKLVRELCRRISGTPTFETLLFPALPDSAVLGPYDLPRLRDKGEHVRRTIGFLPNAGLAILDEIGKVSPTLIHSLAAILNERIYHEVSSGRDKQAVPLHSAFALSNQLFHTQQQDLTSIWDRILLRVEARPLSEVGMQTLLRPQQPDLTAPLPTWLWLSDTDKACDEVAHVVVPENIINIVVLLRTACTDAGLVFSDRRWHQYLGVLQANAWLNGHQMVTNRDLCQTARLVFWNKPPDSIRVDSILADLLDGHDLLPLYDVLLSDINSIEEAIPNPKQYTPERREWLVDGLLKALAEVAGKLDLVKGNHREILQGCIDAVRNKMIETVTPAREEELV